MFVLIIYAIIGYLFFKYLWPMLNSNDPEKKPKELYAFYDKHPKLFVVTIIFALLGINEVISMIGGIFEFIFVPCYPDSGTISISCWIKDGLGFV
ncbi:hypothetical protein NPIRD3C_0515 [Nitrosopumilus piranensis]|uniref:Uncharacterized protein n=2 Tax=Nitrosopumilus piranensis TaxID=1582439 RepID=A0A0C5BU63_9ARCH|nr:hypothetical protein NPIRD3C_0515 [Nitrosopumilus piranensis]